VLIQEPTHVFSAIIEHGDTQFLAFGELQFRRLLGIIKDHLEHAIMGDVKSLYGGLYGAYAIPTHRRMI